RWIRLLPRQCGAVLPHLEAPSALRRIERAYGAIFRPMPRHARGDRRSRRVVSARRSAPKGAHRKLRLKHKEGAVPLRYHPESAQRGLRLAEEARGRAPIEDRSSDALSRSPLESCMQISPVGGTFLRLENGVTWSGARPWVPRGLRATFRA